MTERTKGLEGLTLYTLAEVQPILGVSYRSLQRYVQSGQLKAIKVAGRWRVRKDALEDFLQVSTPVNTEAADTKNQA